MVAGNGEVWAFAARRLLAATPPIVNVARWWIADHPLTGTPMAIADIARYRLSRKGSSFENLSGFQKPVFGRHLEKIDGVRHGHDRWRTVQPASAKGSSAAASEMVIAGENSIRPILPSASFR